MFSYSAIYLNFYFTCIFSTGGDERRNMNQDNNIIEDTSSKIQVKTVRGSYPYKQVRLQVDSELTNSDNEYDENVTVKTETQECSWSTNLKEVSTNHTKCVKEDKSSTQTEDTRENIDTREDRCNQITHKRESVMFPNSNIKHKCLMLLAILFIFTILSIVFGLFVNICRIILLTT